MPTPLQALLTHLRTAAAHDANAVAPPTCILWPDKEHAWEAALPLLRPHLPELLTFGELDPERKTGPAIWLRTVLAGARPDIALPPDRVPVLYLPGVSRQELRAVGDCPDLLAPIAPLQYSGTWWSQTSGRDWTPAALLVLNDVGLCLDIAGDAATRRALDNSLAEVLQTDVEILRSRTLTQESFERLLVADLIRMLLRWLNGGDAFVAGLAPSAWEAFCAGTKRIYKFLPEADGQLTGASRLAARAGALVSVGGLRRCTMR